MRPDFFLEPCQFFHEFLIYLQAAGRIDYEHVAAFFLCLFTRCPRDIFGTFAVPVGVYRHVGGFTHDFELIYGRRPVNITGAEHRLFTVLFQINSQLAAGGRLTCTLKSDHEQGGKPAR